MVVPEDVGGRLGAVADGAGQVYSTALVHVQIWPSQNGRRWH